MRALGVENFVLRGIAIEKNGILEFVVTFAVFGNFNLVEVDLGKSKSGNAKAENHHESKNKSNNLFHVSFSF